MSYFQNFWLFNFFKSSKKETITVLSRYDEKTIHQRTYLVDSDLYKEHQAVMALKKKGNRFAPDDKYIDTVLRNAGSSPYGENGEIIAYSNGQVSRESDYDTEGKYKIIYSRDYNKDTGLLESCHFKEEAFYQIKPKTITVSFVNPAKNDSALSKQFRSLTFNRPENRQDEKSLVVTCGTEAKSGKALSKEQVFSVNSALMDLNMPLDKMSTYQQELSHVADDIRKLNKLAKSPKYIDLSSLKS